MLYFEKTDIDSGLTEADLKEGLYAALEKLGAKQKVLALPPDITRYYSRAGLLTQFAWQYYGETMTDILPALGTHFPMTDAEIDRMPALLGALVDAGRIAPGAWIVVERPANHTWTFPNGLAPDAEYRYGQTGISLGVHPSEKGT